MACAVRGDCRRADANVRDGNEERHPCWNSELPDLGEGISEAEIISWHVKEGDVVAEHQDLLEVETDKAIVAVPSPAAGRVGKLHHAPGDTVQVGEVLVTLETSDEPVAAGATNGHHAAASVTAERIREAEAASPSAPPPAAAATDMVPAAPAGRARRWPRRRSRPPAASR